MSTCPRCHSDNLRRSRSRNRRERLVKALGWRAMRCRERACGWRGLVKIKPTREALAEYLGLNKQTFLLLGVSLGLIVFMVVVMLILFR